MNKKEIRKVIEKRLENVDTSNLTAEEILDNLIFIVKTMRELDEFKP